MKETKRNDNGVEFTMIEDMQIEAETAINNTKVILRGNGSITIAENQRRYPDQIIFQCYIEKGVPYEKLERNPSQYNRAQIFFGKEQGIQACKMLLRACGEMD